MSDNIAMPAVFVRKGRRTEISIIKEDEHNKIVLLLHVYTHDSCSYATQPRMNSTPSVGLVLRRRSRVMSLIRSQVVTSRSLFQTVGYQVTCMHITVSLITFIELLSIHCKHDTHKSTVLVRFCFAEP